MNVGKTIAKTAGITAGIFFGVLLLIVLIFAAVAPASLATFGDKLGFSYVAINFSERAYSRSEDINDLSTLFDRTVKYNKSKKTLFYGELLTENEHFADYCAFRDRRDSALGVGSYRVYVTGNYVAALYQADKQVLALSTAWRELLLMGTGSSAAYPGNSAMRYFVDCFARGGGISVETQLLVYLEDDLLPQVEQAYLSDSSKKADLLRLYVDLYQVHRACFHTEQATLYQEKYDALKAA